MRKVSRILASWVVAASVGSVAVADDTDGFIPPPAPPAEGGSASGVSLTDPISTTPKSRAFDPFATEPSPGRTQSPSHSSFSVQGGAAKRAGHTSAAAGDQSNHHATAASPFDDPTPSGSGTQTSASAWSASPSTASASGGLDASHAPTVCLQWVKRSPIVVG